MPALERRTTSNSGMVVAMKMTKPTSPAKHLLREATKVYSCAASKFERWLVAMDKDYLLRIVVWRFSKSFDELKRAILSDLDNGFESLQFIMQISPKFMPGMVNSALQQVACDHLWTKTLIEKAFRIWSLAAGSNKDKRLFREVLIQLYKYVTKSLITWLTQHGPSIAEDSPFLQELGKVIELLLKSVQCIAHHGSLNKTHKRLSFRGLFSGGALTTQATPTAEGSILKKRFLMKSQKRLENAFVEQMKYLRRDIGQRKNSVKCARWLMLAVPHEVKSESIPLRPDLLPSKAPLTPPHEPHKRKT